MKKKNLLILYLLTLGPLTGCSTNENIELTFTQREYQLKSGEKIEVNKNYKNVKYQLINNPFDSISINEDNGTLTFDDTIPNYTQVMAIATYKEFVSEPCVVTLTYDYHASEVRFTNMSSYIVNNEYVNAVSSRKYSVLYSLKEKVDGVYIESETGKVTFAPIVKNETKFTVIADSHGSKEEKEFIAMTEGFVEAITNRQALEKDNSSISAFYPLDFAKSTVTSGNIIAVVDSLNNPIDKNYYKYDTKKQRLEILPSILETLSVGSNTFKIITERNSVSITLDVITKFINTVEDLVAISDSIESLSGYYILMNDLNLEDYLAKEGYNEGKGWTPIGIYTDTLDTNIATQYSFKGTFDGNGHVIRGLYANRKDTASFNAGLFGYTTASATIRNLGVEGELTVSSYSGGLVGSNNGVIENCWANVNMNVASGENAYRYVGGFVGNNFGTIKNCYSIGDVNCDSYYGSFVGSNTGFIENCYAPVTENSTKFVGFGTVDKSCVLFDNMNQMKEFDFSKTFDNKNWEFISNDYPSLKEVLEEYNLRGINISIENKKYFKGDIINYSIEIYPKSLEEQYKNFVKVKVNEKDGFIKLSNSIHTENASSQDCTIEASINYNNQTFTCTKIIPVYDKIESIEFTNNLEYVEAGKRYALSSNITPSNALNDNVTYHLQSRYLGVEIKDNILSISDECTVNSIKIYAETESGLKTNILEIPVKTQKVVPSGVVTIYEGENTNLEFEFDQSTNLENIEVSVFNKKVNYQISNNKVIVSRSVLEASKDMKARFIFKINNDIYGIDTYYFSHARYTIDSLKNEEVILINSVEDFYNNFNVDPSKAYDENKVKNYNKTFVLTKDLNLNDKEIYAIGHGDAKFSGKFYGMGHTISNFKIKNNEKKFIENSDSCLYGVGLFGALSGSVYDLNLKDAKITGNNFVGGFVGMVTDGYLENCKGYNLKVVASDYEYSSEDVKVGKIVGKMFSGQVICAYHDNVGLNIIG